MKYRGCINSYAHIKSPELRHGISSALSLQFRAERLVEAVGEVGGRDAERELHEGFRSQLLLELFHEPRIDLDLLCHLLRIADRKSTRLNSSHLVISYAVFCLKKKN